eukprot:gene4932-21272_t
MSQHQENQELQQREESEQREQEEIYPQSPAMMFGIKTPEILLDESRKMRDVAKQTLDLFLDTVDDVFQRNRPSELRRTKKRIEEKLVSLKKLNQQISEYMIQMGVSCEEVAQFNFRSESDLDAHEDTIADIEDALQRLEKKKAPEIRTNVVAQQNAKLPKLQINAYAGEPLKWREFWEQFKNNIHSSSLEATTKFSYLRELLIGKASAVIRGLSLSAENYEVAIDLLQQEFGDDTRLRSAHIKAIREVQPVANAHHLKQLRRFYEDVSINFASLRSMGYEAHVMCLVEETVMKLPRPIRYELTKDDRSWTKWDFTRFLERLWIYLKTCEEIEPTETLRFEPSSSRRQVVNTTITTRVNECVYCKGSHKAFECTNVSRAEKKTNPSEPEAVSEASRPSAEAIPGTTRAPTRDHNGHIQSGPAAYQTVIAKVGGQRCRILLDGGSGKSYISREHGRKIAGNPVRTEIRIIGTVNGEKEVKCPVYNLEVAGVGKANGNRFSTEFAELDLYMLTSVPNAHPEKQRQKFAHLEGIWFSDVSQEDSLPIHAILGVRDYAHIRTGKMIKGNDNEPMAEETILGWTLMGAIQDQQSNAKQSVANLMIEQPRSVHDEFRQLYDLDVLGIKESGEDVFEEFKDSISRDEEGRYSVKLPWKKGNFFLPSNKQMCQARLTGQLKKLKKSPEDLKTYDDVIQQQLKDGIVEPVPENPDGKHVHYLPHHAVIRREAETTKLRIVYDCSAKERKYDKSMNDCLHIGPPLQPLLYDILIRFRMYPVALLGDIQQAFLQIKVDKEDRDAMRFLWPKHVSKADSEIQELRFTRVIFGSGPSPFLLGATIRQHMEQYKAEDPEFVDRVTKSLFVDDMVCGGANTDEVSRLKQKLIERFKNGHFNMRKWKSNVSKLRDQITPTSRYSEQTAMQPRTGSTSRNNAKEKVLGVAWNQETDVMGVSFEKVSTMEHEPTQRGILRTVAAIYDPIGSASPITILAKIIYHEVCMRKFGWDGEISADLLKRWKKWLANLKDHPVLTFDRCLIAHPQERIESIEIHGFADSSVVACCAVIYLKITQSTGTYVKQLTAKARVAKPNTSVPRLELIGAQMLTKLIQNVKSVLELDVSQTYGWLDSQTVLCWLENNGEWKQFVRKRVDQILAAEVKWMYCPTEFNPADLGTRGTTAGKLQHCDKWWEGPTWLTKRENWPTQPQAIASEEAKAEMRQATAVIATTEVTLGISSFIDPRKYSSGKKLFRITAWIWRFVNKLKGRSLETAEALTIREIKAAEDAWIKDIQNQHKPTSEQVNQLGLRVDGNGILRCFGRFQQHEDQQPIYLPKQHHLTSLLIMDSHRRVLHMGVASTLAEIRSRFWVPKGRQEVKKMIRSCNHCKRYSAKPYEQPATAPIPDFRVTPGYAFLTTGVDFAGPFYCKDGRRQKKTYITLFTCATSRAVHIELVEDLTAKTFRKSLKSLMTRRGTPQLIVSDNAKTFQATARWLQSILDDEVLTPNHLVHGRRIKPIREEEIFSDEDKIPARKRLRYLQKCREKYWKRWSREYLTSLREYHKIHHGGCNEITVGDIVLVKDENLTRNKWKLGKVLHIIRGRDGIERGVTLKTTTRGRTYEIDRPVQNLYPLELRADSDEKRVQETRETGEVADARPKRKAALDAKSVIKATQMLEEENQT